MISLAYIAVRKNREGKKYVYLVEGYRVGDKVKNRTLKSYGKLDTLEKEEPGILERLRREAREGVIGEKETTSLTVTFDLKSEIDYEDKNYGWKLLDDVYRFLEIKPILSTIMEKNKMAFNLDDILRLLVFQRFLNPGSKLATINSQSELFGGWDINQNSVYRSLTHLDDAKEAIQFNAHHAITKKIGRVATLVFYDVTNYSFEIDLNDSETVDEKTGEVIIGKRKKGMCKDNGKDPIIQMGLFMDSNGIPISYKLFEGNKPDVSTYIDAIKQVKEQFGIERVVVVADKAMNSGNNIIKTSNNGDGWLFSQKHRGKKGVCKKLQEFILDPVGWEFNKEMSFGKKSMIRKRELKTTTKPYETKEVTEKVLVTWNKKYADREKIRRDGALEYASKLTNARVFYETCKKGGKKYLELYTIDETNQEKKPFNPLIELNKEAIEFDEQFDGVNVLVTSEIDMSDEEILRSYKELAKIEDSFKVTKTDFETKPVYVYKPSHIEAHFLTCFLALLIMRIIQHKINNQMSPSRIIKALNSAKANPLEKGFYRVQANEDMKILNELIGIKWTDKFAKVEQINHYGKGWCTTPKKQ